jgi:DNA repair exonuclease SbcCD ATPase subunit
MQNNEEILKKIEKLRNSYQAEIEDQEEETASLLDQVNDLVRSIFNDSSLTIYTVFDKQSLEKWKKNRLSRIIKNFIANNLKNFFYFALLVTITLFLVSEALEFYSVDGVIDTKTYVKAILTEVCFIFLSGYRSDTKLQTAAVGVLRVSIFCLMLFVITSKTFMSSTKTVGSTNVIEQQVAIVEQQIKEKEANIKFYQEKKWPWTVRQLITEKDALVSKLMELKQKQLEGATKEVSKLVEYEAYGKAFFRVLLLFISILITRRIFIF